MHQFEQVLLNLAVNARDAMPDGGRLLPLAHVGAATTAAWSPPRASDSDTGRTEEVRRAGLRPVLHDQAAGQGTGLGLATVYGIVPQAGGESGSNPSRQGHAGGGELPGSPEVAGEADGAAGPEARPGPRADDPAGGGRGAGAGDGCPDPAPPRLRVVEAASAQEALAMFRALDRRRTWCSPTWRCRACRELSWRLGSARALRRWCSCRATPTRRWAIRTRWPRSAGFIQKPFSAAALLHRVGEALAGAAPSV